MCNVTRTNVSADFKTDHTTDGDNQNCTSHESKGIELLEIKHVVSIRDARHRGNHRRRNIKMINQ